MYSLVIPVYRNEGSLSELLDALSKLNRELDGAFQVVFVVDGSPDRSAEILRSRLPECEFRSSLVLHSRNFGSFAAIRTGLEEAEGQYFAVMAADLQEPPELVLEFFRKLRTGNYDVALGTRTGRSDPWISRTLSEIYWWFYRKWVQPEMPAGGIDVFACNRAFRDVLVHLRESNSSLVGLILWMGFRRCLVPYARLERRHGRSAWTFRKKWRYLTDSIFAFSDLPVRVLTSIGAMGMVASVLLGLIVVSARLLGDIPVPGYTATVLIVLFFGALNCFGIGLVGSYVWRAFENTKGRPQSIILQRNGFKGRGTA